MNAPSPDAIHPGSDRRLATITITIPGVSSPVRFVRSHHGEFWELFESGQWEPENIELLVRLLRPGSALVDVGAWIGPLTIIAASLGARVRAFEPDPVAREHLVANLAVNPDVGARVMVEPVALSTRDGLAVLATAALGDSMASFAHGGHQQAEVRTIDAKAWSRTADFLTADVLKMDIEGAEFAVIPRMRGAFRVHRPVMLLSVHGNRFRPTRGPGRSGSVARRAWSAMSRARLLHATRHYRRRWIWSPVAGRWRPLRGRTLLHFLGSLGNHELVLADEDLV